MQCRRQREDRKLGWTEVETHKLGKGTNSAFLHTCSSQLTLDSYERRIFIPKTIRRLITDGYGVGAFPTIAATKDGDTGDNVFQFKQRMLKGRPLLFISLRTDIGISICFVIDNVIEIKQTYLEPSGKRFLGPSSTIFHINLIVRSDRLGTPILCLVTSDLQSHNISYDTVLKSTFILKLWRKVALFTILKWVVLM